MNDRRRIYAKDNRSAPILGDKIHPSGFAQVSVTPQSILVISGTGLDPQYGFWVILGFDAGKPFVVLAVVVLLPIWVIVGGFVHVIAASRSDVAQVNLPLVGHGEVGGKVGKGSELRVLNGEVEIEQRVAPGLDDGVVSRRVAGAGVRDVVADDEDDAVRSGEDLLVHLGELRQPRVTADQVPRDEPVAHGDVAVVDDAAFVVEIMLHEVVVHRGLVSRGDVEFGKLLIKGRQSGRDVFLARIWQRDVVQGKDARRECHAGVEARDGV